MKLHYHGHATWQIDDGTHRVLIDAILAIAGRLRTVFDHEPIQDVDLRGGHGGFQPFGFLLRSELQAL